MFSILYWAAPNVRHPGFRWLSPGGVFAVVLWLIAWGLFAVYVASFSSYNKTYGAMASVIVFLVWLWVSNVAILLGAELNRRVGARTADHRQAPGRGGAVRRSAGYTEVGLACASFRGHGRGHHDDGRRTRDGTARATRA